MLIHPIDLFGFIGDFKAKERPEEAKLFADNELRYVMGESPTQTLKNFSTSLAINESIVCRRWHAMGKIQKDEK